MHADALPPHNHNFVVAPSRRALSCACLRDQQAPKVARQVLYRYRAPNLSPSPPLRRLCCVVITGTNRLSHLDEKMYAMGWN